MTDTKEQGMKNLLKRCIYQYLVGIQNNKKEKTPKVSEIVNSDEEMKHSSGQVSRCFFFFR